MANDAPGLGRFKKVAEGSAAGRSRQMILVSDLVRISASIWGGLWLWSRSATASKPEIIYERVAVFQSLSSFHAARKSAIRVVESNGLMARETAQDRKALFFQGLAERLERHVYRSADLVVAVSEGLATEIQEFASIPRSRLLVIPNAIPSSLPTIPRQDQHKFLIGFSGSLVGWQQLDKLILAYHECRKQDPVFASRAEIVIIGDGPVKPSLVQLSRDLNIDENVRFISRMPQDALFEQMASWKAGYAGHEKSSSASMYHSPLKMYEYAGLGLAAISTRTPDASSLKSAGMQIHFFDTEQELASALLDVFHEVDKSPSTPASRSALYKLHSWESRVRLLMSAVKPAIEMTPR